MGSLEGKEDPGFWEGRPDAQRWTYDVGRPCRQLAVSDGRGDTEVLKTAASPTVAPILIGLDNNYKGSFILAFFLLCAN